MSDVSSMSNDFSRSKFRRKLRRLLLWKAKSLFGMKEEDIPKDIVDNMSLFQYILECVEEIYKKKVVVIIDEYDSPITSQIGNPNLQVKIQTELADVFGVLKSRSDFIRLVFITGICKFQNVSMFSKLNNLQDHTFSVAAGTLLGYTRDEMLKYYRKELESLRMVENLDCIDALLEAMRSLCIGYVFGHKKSMLSETVFNPYATNQALSTLDLDTQYWCLFGSASLLAKVIIEQNHSVASYVANPVLIKSETLSRSTSCDHVDINTLMY